MMDVYNGNVTTDSKGFATVKLPNWFQALNRSFRYLQKTAAEQGKYLHPELYRKPASASVVPKVR